MRNDGLGGREQNSPKTSRERTQMKLLKEVVRRRFSQILVRDRPAAGTLSQAEFIRISLAFL